MGVSCGPFYGTKWISRGLQYVRMCLRERSVQVGTVQQVLHHMTSQSDTVQKYLRKKGGKNCANIISVHFKAFIQLWLYDFQKISQFSLIKTCIASESWQMLLTASSTLFFQLQKNHAARKMLNCEAISQIEKDTWRCFCWHEKYQELISPGETQKIHF